MSQPPTARRGRTLGAVLGVVALGCALVGVDAATGPSTAASTQTAASTPLAVASGAGADQSSPEPAAGAASSSTATLSAAGQQTIAVREKDVFTTQDLGKKGMTRGDRLAVYATLTRAGKKVGDGGGDCVLISGNSEKNAVYNCAVTYRFGGSTLTTTGLYDLAQTNGQFAITGGTGKFANAHGVLDFKELAPETFDNVFRFTTS